MSQQHQQYQLEVFPEPKLTDTKWDAFNPHPSPPVRRKRLRLKAVAAALIILGVLVELVAGAIFLAWDSSKVTVTANGHTTTCHYAFHKCTIVVP